MFRNIPDILGDIPKQRKMPMDKGIITMLVFICAFGLIMIWSASMYNAKLEGNEFYYVGKQLIYLLVGFVLMYIVSLVNFRYIKVYSNLIMGISVALLFIVMLLPESEGVGGAVRWIRIGNLVMQPSELSKLGVLMFMSNQTELRADSIRTLKTFLMLTAFCGILCVLIYSQPALSTAIIVAGLIIGMYFAAGGNLGYMFSLIGVCGVAVFVMISQNQWRMDRLLAYLDPFSDLLGDGWQPAQSLMALGSGGIFGVGIGNGRAKLNFLPEPQNDYIFAIIGEELGLLGCIALIGAYFVLIFMIIKVAIGAPDTYSRMFCIGMAILLFIQVFLNIAVVTNLIPSTGVVLPFVSSGGSSLITLLFAMGIVLNISRNIKTKI